MKKSVFVRCSLQFLKLLVLATVMPFAALAQDSDTILQPNPPPELSLPPLELPVARDNVSFEKVKHPATGDIYVLQKTQYEDGTMVQTLAAVWLDQPLALEILVLDDFVPAPRLLPASSNAAAPIPSADSERLFVDFNPTWALDIVATPQFLKTDLILGKPLALSELGACPQGQWRGVARFQAESFAPLFPPKLSTFDVANFVCLRKVP